MALSRLRSALREDPFDRDPRGPVLSGVWVDSQVFDELAARAHRSWGQAQPDEALAAAAEADSLCLSHLVPDAGGGWATEYRERHNATHRELLGDAGEAALSLLRPREAAEFADRLVALDPFHERACRTLMLAATAIGEVDRALQAYQSCAKRLADELGADPSAQTRAVYLQVLRAGPVAGRPVPFVGREAEVAALCTQLSQPGGGRLLIVHGEQGMGTTRLVEQALAAAGGRCSPSTGCTRPTATPWPRWKNWCAPARSRWRPARRPCSPVRLHWQPPWCGPALPEPSGSCAYRP